MSDQPTPPDQIGHGIPDRRLAADPARVAMAKIQPIIEAAEQTSIGIISEAEAQAKGYLEEARRRADRIARQRAQQMSSATEDLIDMAEEIKHRSDELLEALGEAKRGAEETLRDGRAPLDEPSPPPPEAPRLQPPVEPRPAPTPEPAAERPPPLAPEPRQRVEPSEPQAPPVRLQVPPEPAPPSAAPPPQPPPPAPAPPPPAPPSIAQPSEGARLLATQMAVAGSNRAEIAARLRDEFGVSGTGPMLDAMLGSEEGT